MWNDLACTTTLHFICQSPTKKYTRCPSPGNENCPTTSAPVTPVTEPTVPPKHQEKYKLSIDKLDYTQALQACKDQTMQLVSIQTKVKNDEINILIQKSGIIEPFWTSGNRVADGKTWGEPNNAKTNENAIEVFKAGADTKWNDAPLDLKNRYICESIITSGCGSQCCSSVVNVYVNNNVISSNGTEIKKIYSSSISKPGQSYDVEVKNNINDEHTPEKGLEKIHSRGHHISEKKHTGRHPDLH
ncbi:hypothetical protein JTB14_014810 [Gonioctena quinquepunctata]|nr:hypothetical protein JTB14_014810 [Gonioctena quinquepunctata]